MRAASVLHDKEDFTPISMKSTLVLSRARIKVSIRAPFKYMRFWETLSYSDEGLTVRVMPLLAGLLVGGALYRFFRKSGLRYPVALIGVFFMGVILTMIPVSALMAAFSDESVNSRRLNQIHKALSIYKSEHGRYPADLESLMPRYLAKDDQRALFMKGGKGLPWGYVPASRYKITRPSQVVLYGPILVRGQGIIVHRDGLVTSYSEEKFKALLSEVLPDTHLRR